MFTNTDWDLIRQIAMRTSGSSPVRPRQIEHVVTAVGSGGSDEDVISAGDYDVCELATPHRQRVRCATHTVLHTYQVPAWTGQLRCVRTRAFGAAPGDRPRTIAEGAGIGLPRRMAAAITAFAEYFHVDPERDTGGAGAPA